MNIIVIVLFCVLVYSETYTPRDCRKPWRPGDKKGRRPCCEGWGYNARSKSCQPICRPGCINGNCIGPNKCVCEPPLVLNYDKCLPDVVRTCTPACGPNTTCTYKNNCICNDKSHISINGTHCAPRCRIGYFNDPIECKPKCDKCVNGYCSAPGVCDCIDGYKKADDQTCVATCNPTCENATCVGPNVCLCYDRFYKVNESKCAPVCTNCTHGDCTAPDECKCHKGYEKREGVCEPVCETPCMNGKCVEPNKCQCDVGYEEDPNNKFNCLPICEPKCVNASCVSPNTCSCHTGYETTGNRWTCKPRCNVCDNGICIKPDECQCNPGYQKVNGTCEPKCSEPCKNGTCSQPEVCSCMKGYLLSSEDKYTCDPICEPKCVNSSCAAPGVCQCWPKYNLTEAKHECRPHCDVCEYGDCIAPDECRCHKGYNMTQGACSPVCSTECVNSRCTLPETCSCIEGYTKNLTAPSICYKECPGLCDHGACDLHGRCVCDPGYELLNDTCVPNLVYCNACVSNCSEDTCRCSNGLVCIQNAEVASTNLAGLELTWMLGAAVGFLLIVLVLVMIVRNGQKRHRQENKSPLNEPSGSVVFTVADTLIQGRPMDHDDSHERFYEEVPIDRTAQERETNTRLLQGVGDERL